MVSVQVWLVIRWPCCEPCNEGLPLRVEDGCQGGLGCDLVEAMDLLVGALVAKLAELFLVVAPRHVVFAPMLGTSLYFLFMRFSFLGRCLLSVFVSLLFLLVGVVLVVLLFPVIPSTLFLASCLIVILGSRGPLQVGCQLKLVSESGEFCLHGHDLVFIR